MEKRFRGRAWNYPVAPLVRIEVQRKDYIAVVTFLNDRGTRDIFCSDKGIWLLSTDVEAIQAVKDRFTVHVVTTCPKPAEIIQFPAC